MRTFKDNAGRTWTLAVNVAQIKRVRGLLGIDLYGLVSDGFAGLGKFLSDPIQLVDCLYVLCKDEADKLGVSDEDFGRSLYGDSIQRATDAFMEEYIDFFPDPRVRTGLQKLTTKGRAVQERLMALMEEKLDSVDPDLLAISLSGQSGASPASSESTPDPSRSGNSI